jgi:hypothetical protein
MKNPAPTPHRRTLTGTALAVAGLLHVLAPAAVQAAPAQAARPASAPASSAASQDAGTWMLSKDGEGAPACRVKLERRRVIGGSALSVHARCAEVTPRSEDLYAWYRNKGGELVMADPQRHAVLVFHALPNGVWATQGSDDERLLLQRAGKR